MNRDHITTGYSGTNVLLAFAAGALIGAVAALLLSPAPGAETRRKLREAAREAARSSGELARRVSGVGREGIVEEDPPDLARAPARGTGT